MAEQLSPEEIRQLIERVAQLTQENQALKQGAANEPENILRTPKGSPSVRRRPEDPEPPGQIQRSNRRTALSGKTTIEAIAGADPRLAALMKFAENQANFLRGNQAGVDKGGFLQNLAQQNAELAKVLGKSGTLASRSSAQQSQQGPGQGLQIGPSPRSRPQIAGLQNQQTTPQFGSRGAENQRIMDMLRQDRDLQLQARQNQLEKTGRDAGLSRSLGILDQLLRRLG